MGGLAFANFGLYTPRIPPSTYQYVVEKTTAELKELFLRVESTIGAPEKKDHGDVDIMVVPHHDRPVPSIKEIAGHLGSSKWFGFSKTSHHFAIPWPEIHSSEDIDKSGNPIPALAEDVNHLRLNVADVEDQDPFRHPQNLQELSIDDELPQESLPSISSHSGQDPTTTSQRYIQIDVTVISDEPSLQWSLFSHAHGDLVNILSSILRHRGLTINNQALYLRIPDLEAENRKLGRVEVTRDTNLVLMFLGLDTTRFWKPFTTLDEMMEYITGCVFYDPQKPDDRDANTNTNADKEGTTTAQSTTYIAAVLNDSGDRKRVHSRPAFRYWYNTFLPSHSNDHPGPQAHLSREEVIDMTFEFFGSGLKERYMTQTQELEAFIGKNRLWSDVRKRVWNTLPDLEDKEMQEIVKALKREVLPNIANGEDVVPEAVTLTKVQRAYINNQFEEVITWSVENYPAVVERYRQRVVESSNQPTFPLDKRKANPFSTSELEIYSAEEDEVIARMKKNGKSWGDILAVLGKKSRSQLQAHWKQKLEQLDTRGGRV